MKNTLQNIRGTKDLLGTEQLRFDYIVSTGKKIASLYSFERITTPIIEFSEVFDRSLGETSDVVNKEMYSFQDRGGENITLRPEFTAAICRSFISNGLDHQLPLKFFSHGPIFRYERPQKGRQRQFHQLNYEILGMPTYHADIEIIQLSYHLLKALGIDSKVTLNINSLGCNKSRIAYRTALVEYLTKFYHDLSADSKLRFEKNPLRILDSKDPSDNDIVASAPLINAYYTKEASAFYDALQRSLDDKGIAFVTNPRIVRGLDYYTHTAFEFVTSELGAQGTVIAGGRYDNLIKHLGGKDIPGVGCAPGIERLMLLLDSDPPSPKTIAIIPMHHEQYGYAASLADVLRYNDFHVYFDLDENADSNKRMKKALTKHAAFALFVGEQEVAKDCVTIRDLSNRVQTQVGNADLIDHLEHIMR
jgi:histidyl-tRNA synthetase